MNAKRSGGIAVVYNGYHPRGEIPDAEREANESVARDARSVRDALAARGRHAFLLPMRRSAGAFMRRLAAASPRLVFNLCEGAGGESRCEMHACAFLDLLGMPHTGCGPLALGIALDKALAKALFIAGGIPTPPHFVCAGEPPLALPAGMRYPLFVKPVREDASIGIGRDAFVRNRRELSARCRRIHARYRQPALVERYVDGRELNVSILGALKPLILPVSEIEMGRMSRGAARICDYRAKWVPGSEEYARTAPRCPARLPRAAEARVKQAALAAYRALSCDGYARVDIRLGRDGVPYVLEVNPNPCIAPDAGLARSAAAAGMSYPDLVCRIADLAGERR
ncbi:MAG: ATP-grasp domain-containing protein [Chlamydiota bacterium]